MSEDRIDIALAEAYEGGLSAAKVQIADFLAKVAELEAQVCFLQGLDEIRASRIAALEAERDGLRMDADRYRWLRGVYFSGTPAAHMLGRMDDADGMDAAIDAALQSRPEEWPEICPNCVTPWKCNGPHIPLERRKGERRVRNIGIGHRAIKATTSAATERSGTDRRKP